MLAPVPGKPFSNIDLLYIHQSPSEMALTQKLLIPWAESARTLSMLLYQRLQTILRAHIHSCQERLLWHPVPMSGILWDILSPAEKPGEVPAAVGCGTCTRPPSLS